MDDVRLRMLAEAFCAKVWAEYAELPLSREVEREFWLRQYLNFGREVAAAAREADHARLTLIRDMAQTQYERLTPRDRMMNIGRVLQNIVELVDAAIRGAN